MTARNIMLDGRRIHTCDDLLLGIETIVAK
jgi:hypothetical protein